jgi:hypothetical protein
MLTRLLEREAKKAPSDCKMKAKLTILLIALTSGAHANLIDLTPGAFNINEPWPQPVIQFFSHQFGNGNGFQFLAGANIKDGQVVWSPFTIFGSDNFGIILQDPANAQVSWNLTNTGGYFLQYVLLEGANGIDNLYGLRGPGFQFEGGGRYYRRLNRHTSHHLCRAKSCARDTEHGLASILRRGRTLTHV